MKPEIGDKGICKLCDKPIYFSGRCWTHTGQYQPRHGAKPKEEPKTRFDPIPTIELQPVCLKIHDDGSVECDLDDLFAGVVKVNGQLFKLDKLNGRMELSSDNLKLSLVFTPEKASI